MISTALRHLPLLAAILAPVHAQPEEIADLVPVNALEITELFDALRIGVTVNRGLDVEDSPAEVDFERFSLSAILSKPIPVGGNWSLLPYFDYFLTDLDVSPEPLAAIPGAPELSDTYHSVGLPFFLLNSGSRWTYGLWVRPSISSDFESIDSDDFILEAGLGVAYRVNDCLYIGAGVYGTDLTNDPYFIGGPGFFWMPSDEWLVAYYGPRFIARREFGDRTQVGFEAVANGGAWNAEEGGQSYKVSLRSWRAGLFARRKIVGEFWLEAGLGYTFLNSLDLSTPSGRDLYENRLGDLDSAPYAYLGVSVTRW